MISLVVIITLECEYKVIAYKAWQSSATDETLFVVICVLLRDVLQFTRPHNYEGLGAILSI